MFAVDVVRRVGLPAFFWGSLSFFLVSSFDIAGAVFLVHSEAELEDAGFS